MTTRDLMDYIKNQPHIATNKALASFVAALSTNCDFLDAWKDRSPRGLPVSEMGYSRSDYDGHRWWTTHFLLNDDLKSPQRAEEIDLVTNNLQAAFPNLSELGLFCELFAEDLRRDNEYNLYYKGRYANYWIRCVIRKRDYNLYVHAIIPARKEV